MDDFKLARVTPVEHEGAILVSNEGYMVLGNDDVVCFYVDIIGGSAYIDAYTTRNKSPAVCVTDENSDNYTIVWFPEFENFRVHSCKSGKILAITLVNI